MTRETLMDAVTALDGEFLDEALCERARLLPRATRRIKPLAVKWMSMAACLALVLLAIPYAKLVFSGSNSEAPDTKLFASVEEAEAALGEGLLLERLEASLSRTDDIRVTYTSDYYAAEGNLMMNGDDGAQERPLMLVATYKVTESLDGVAEDPLPGKPVETSAVHEIVTPVPEDPAEDEEPPLNEATSPGDMPEKDESSFPSAEWAATTSVRLYILFGCDSVEDSYIGGYEEQGLTRRYGEILVHYSLIEDPLMHGQAKFLYGGDLYVLDVQSTGDTHDLMKYLDLLLGEEEAS